MPEEFVISQARVSWSLRVDLGLFFLLLLVTLAVPAIYVSSERFFHYWDTANYYNLVSASADAFRQGPLGALREVKYSIANDYNKIFTVPLVPFMLFFGESRVVYVVSAALVYLLPFTLMIGAVATQLIPFHPRIVFWSAVALTLLTPMVWHPVLVGYPDVGGGALVLAAVWAYLHDIKLGRWWQIPVIGISIAAAMLFRRHFALAGVAFFAAAGLQTLASLCREMRQDLRGSLRNFFRVALRLTLTGAVSLITLAVIGWDFFYNAMIRDYGVHSSWVEPVGVNIRYYGAQYGWASWLFAGFGLGVAVRSRLADRPAALFIALFGGLSLTQWVFVVRQLDRHYAYHFTLFVVLGLTALGFVAWMHLRGSRRVLAMTAAAIFLLANTVVGLTPGDTLLKNHPMRTLFSAGYPRLINDDYDQIARMIAYLRAEAARRGLIYVVATSYDVNASLLRNAEIDLYGRSQSVLNIPDVPNVDSRDSYARALEIFMQAQYALVASPFQQSSTKPGQHKVIEVLFDAFKENWRISQDFTRLPQQFPLTNGVTIDIYRRTRTTSLDNAVVMLTAMRDFIGKRPSGQRDWIVLRKPLKFFLDKNLDNTHTIRIEGTSPGEESLPSFLYLGALPKPVRVAGNLVFENRQCPGATLRVAAVDPRNNIIDATEIARTFSDNPAFALSLRSEGAVYLLLNIAGANHDGPSTDCPVKIDHLVVSGK